MSTTLIEELEDAIEDTEDAANRECYTLQGRDEVNARAASLRQRIAWVRELMAGPRGQLSIAQQLTGPIPSPPTCKQSLQVGPGTATTEGK